VDLSGPGGNAHEDLPERGAGPDIGDYLGLPINDAARRRADSWDTGKWTMIERQCEPHPADYAPRGPASMRISSTLDPVSQDVVSWHTTLMWMLPRRTIYMDGRPHPSPYAQHGWQGFSTGEWEGDMLKVTTTHLKEGWLRRTGVPRSERATVIEYFIRHGDYLTLVSTNLARSNWELIARTTCTPTRITRTGTDQNGPRRTRSVGPTTRLAESVAAVSACAVPVCGRRTMGSRSRVRPRGAGCGGQLGGAKVPTGLAESP
jgi:hypothetical protein